MIKISYYQAITEKLPKAFCQLLEKCYYSNLKTNVFTEDENYSQNLDKILWTYSKKHFIPHATNLDSLKEKQPIYITHNVAEYNQANIVVFVNSLEKNILEFLAKINLTKSHNIIKILFIYDELQKINYDKIKTILRKSHINDYTINLFKQINEKNWEEIK